MSGHVVYSCACLNVRLHLANNYYSDRHDAHRAAAFIRLSDPPLEGWQFELGMGGVQSEYNTLIRTRARDGNWMTVSCLNCTTGDVYSIQRPTKPTIVYPVDAQDIYRQGDRVIIHRETIYGEDIDQLKQHTNYSSNFGIVLYTDATEISADDEASVPGELYSQHTQLSQQLERSLNQMKSETDARIERYRQEQLASLERASAKAKYDRQLLWHKMLEVSRTVHEQEQQEKGLDQDTSDSLSRSFVRFEAHDGMRQQQQQASSSSTGVSASPARSGSRSFVKPSSLRASSFALDEHHISTSLRDKQFHPISHEDEDQSLSSDEESEGMFDLDEDIETEEKQGDEKGKGKSTPTWSKRRSSTKYISGFEGEEYIHNEQEDDQDVLSTSVSAYATSVPIAISYEQHTPKFTQGSFNENAVNPADQDPTSIRSSVQKNTHLDQQHQQAKSLVSFDRFSLADQEASLLFPPHQQRRKSIAVTRTTHRPQLDGLVGQSLDTRSRRMSLLRQDASSTHSASDDEDDKGPMIPPHVLAANTYNDETEELFGAVPRSGTWRKTFE
ncbi:hypothetical protein K492DRAFT_205070 [Lichtheimia hyalospora FSU 10163]|nr:hypothetical protein K492DRAFT_205070 [Lichtheimia hyalospora FSU 10163]